MWKTFCQCLAGTIGEGLVTLLSVTFVDYLGSGCGSVGRAVASDARGLISNLVITNFYIGHLFDYCQLY